MTEENLKWLENVFRRTVGDNGEIRLQDFKNIVHSKNVSFFKNETFGSFINYDEKQEGGDSQNVNCLI